ncbi:MAG: DUF1273 domain-containing protein, partial [Ruminococcus sp.]|nr:DUF1273 domain-containing protein [Ruminococcus sp.]
MLSEDEIDRTKTVCFSGHRTEKLPLFCQTEEGKRIMLSFIAAAADECIKAGYNTFIAGGARGIDIWAALIIAGIKADRPDAGIKLITAVPYRNQSAALTGKELFDYGFALAQSDLVIFLSDDYTKDCHKRRNRFMVDHSSKLIAVLSDPRSGTAQTVRMARES